MSTLNTIINMLQFSLGPMGPILAAFLLLLFLGLIGFAFYMREQANPLARFEASATKQRARFKGNELAGLRGEARNEFLDKYSSLLEPKDEKEMSNIKEKLRAAGYVRRDAVALYYLIQMGLGLGFLLLGMAYYFLIVPEDGRTMQISIFSLVMPGVLGYMAPKYLLGKKIEKRKDEMQSSFPDALDMMLVCVEAGQSLDQAIVRVSRELGKSAPALGYEFEVVANELRAGKDRPTVLNDMAARVDLSDVTSFVSVMIQSAAFGTSIGDALGVYAREMREKRVMRAEEKANKLPVKMTLSTMVLTVPPLLIIMVGPSIVDVMNNMSAVGAN